MTDVLTYVEAMTVARLNARATIAGALIGAKLIELSDANFRDSAGAPNAGGVALLKSAVDAVMAGVVETRD
jgi:hypothetical protein